MNTNPHSLIQALECLTCQCHYPFQLMLEGCPNCLANDRVGILDPVYGEEASHRIVLEKSPQRSLWDYHALLPVPDALAVVSLGEGGSPLVPLQEEGRNWWVKYEAVNPTHSYKDRTNTVAVSAARYFACEKVLCTSTGNHAVALAAYAARAGMRCLILMPPDAPPLSLQEMRFFGAEVVTVNSEQIVPLMYELCSSYGWYISQRNAPGVGGRPFGNPYGMEGYKTIAYEIFHQLGRRVPDKVFLPVGGGDAAWGIYKGFRELHEAGLAAAVPQMIACQSSAGAPLEHAWRHQLDQVEPVDTSMTIAYSIVERQTGDHAYWAIRQSGGRAVAVDDSEIRQAEQDLAAAGICVEPSSAAALAGATQLCQQGLMSEDECAVLIATGAGLRWPATFQDQTEALPRIEGSIDELQRILQL